MSVYQASRQKGVALFIVLILLVVLTTLSLSAMRNATTETKVSANYQHKQITFQTAENMQETLLALNMAEVPRPAQSKDAKRDDVVKIEDKAIGNLKSQGHLSLTYIGKGTNILVGGNEPKNGNLYSSDAIGTMDGSSAKTHTRAVVLFPTVKDDG